MIDSCRNLLTANSPAFSANSNVIKIMLFTFEKGQMLSKWMNGDWSTCGILNADLPVLTHIKYNHIIFFYK
jgi:hypothetical protein